MRLVFTDSGTWVDDPTAEHVRGVVLDLRTHANVVLEAGSDDRYLQAALYEDNPLVLEYQDGSLDRHYGTEFDLLSPGDTDTLVEIFLSYLRQDDRWRTMVEWYPLDLTEG